MIRALLVLTALVGFVDQVSADSIPITGTAYIQGADSATFSFSGPSLTAGSGTIDWPVIIARCIPENEACDLNQEVPTGFTYTGFGGGDFGSGSFDGVTANILAGTLEFTASAFIPAGPDLTELTDIPVVVSGEIYAYEADLLTSSLGPLLWSASISATGTLSIYGFQADPSLDLFKEAAYTFAGTATVVPDVAEPRSLLLIGMTMPALIAARLIRLSLIRPL